MKVDRGTPPPTPIPGCLLHVCCTADRPLRGPKVDDGWPKATRCLAVLSDVERWLGGPSRKGFQQHPAVRRRRTNRHVRVARAEPDDGGGPAMVRAVLVPELSNADRKL